MDTSIHELVRPEHVAERLGSDLGLVQEVLEQQRLAINLARAANHVVVMPAVTFSHRGDPLGQWCRNSEDSMFSEEVLKQVQVAEGDDDPLSLGTRLALAAGCPEDLLADPAGPRQIWAYQDIADTVLDLMDITDEAGAGKAFDILEAFWSLAADAAEQVSWVWPYDRLALEREIEDWLVANLDSLNTFGISARLAELDSGIVGRQWRSADGTNRIDLLLEITEDCTLLLADDLGDVEAEAMAGDLIVVELKAVPLTGDAVKQIRRYVTVVADELGGDRMVWGLLIGAGADRDFELERSKEDDLLMSLWLSQTGFFTHFFPRSSSTIA